MNLVFPPTPHQWLRIAQLAFCGGAAWATLALCRPRGKAPALRLPMTVATFFVVAFVTRLLLEDTASRLQMAAFATAALFLERRRARAAGERFSGWRWSLTAGAAVVGVLLAKHIVEPGSISEFGQHVIDEARYWFGS